MKFSGRDPYDALRGERVPEWVRHSARARQAVIQIRKRVPFDLGGVLGVQPFVMAKAAGCALQAAARFAVTGHNGARQEMEAALAALDSSEGRLGGGRWGYEFDVQTRWAYYPRGVPNVIATVFCARALGTAGVASGSDRLLECMFESCAWVADELSVEGSEKWFRYVPSSNRLVHNANFLAAGLVSAAGALAGRSEWIELGLSACRTSLRAQSPSGGFPYGEGPLLRWEDNFHTAYDLDGLLLVWLATGESDLYAALQTGVDYWQRGFFGSHGEPHYTAERRYPYDIHSAATAVDVGLRLGQWGFGDSTLPVRVYDWTIGNLVDVESGETWYQKRGTFVDRRHFVRWGDAHWELAKSAMALKSAGVLDPLEASIRAAHPGTGADEG